ncbi:hypothetical protein N9W41_00480 [bacterium]|nr:hypothetical protein [bacterium]
MRNLFKIILVIPFVFSMTSLQAASNRIDLNIKKENGDVFIYRCVGEEKNEVCLKFSQIVFQETSIDYKELQKMQEESEAINVNLQKGVFNKAATAHYKRLAVYSVAFVGAAIVFIPSTFMLAAGEGGTIFWTSTQIANSSSIVIGGGALVGTDYEVNTIADLDNMISADVSNLLSGFSQTLATDKETFVSISSTTFRHLFTEVKRVKTKRRGTRAKRSFVN